MLVVKGTVSMSCPHVMFSLENEKLNTIYMFFTSSHDLKMFPGMCALVEPWESFVIGVLGAIICLTGVEIVDRLKIDDPVGKLPIYYAVQYYLATLFHVHLDNQGCPRGYKPFFAITDL